MYFERCSEITVEQGLIEPLYRASLGTRDSKLLPVISPVQSDFLTIYTEFAQIHRIADSLNLSAIKGRDNADPGSIYGRRSLEQLRILSELISHPEFPIHIVEAPTSSGKTLLQFIYSLIYTRDSNQLAVVLTSRVNLTEQALEEAKKFLSPAALERVRILHSGVGKKARDEIAQLARTGGILVATAESFLPFFIDSLESNSDLIASLCVDESHHISQGSSEAQAYNRAIAALLENDFSPQGIPISCFSATPLLLAKHKHPHHHMEKLIKFLHVKSAGRKICPHRMKGEDPKIIKTFLNISNPRMHISPAVASTHLTMLGQSSASLKAAIEKVVQGAWTSFSDYLGGEIAAGAGLDRSDFMYGIKKHPLADLFGRVVAQCQSGASPDFEEFWKAMDQYIATSPQRKRGTRKGKSDTIPLKEAFATIGHLRALRSSLARGTETWFMTNCAANLAISRFGMQEVLLPDGKRYPSLERRNLHEGLPEAFKQFFSCWNLSTIAMMQYGFNQNAQIMTDAVQAFCLMACDG